MTPTDAATRFTEAVNSSGLASAKVWQKGEKVRAYVNFPAGYQGGAGKGQVGYAEFSGAPARAWKHNGDKGLFDLLNNAFKVVVDGLLESRETQ